MRRREGSAAHSFPFPSPVFYPLSETHPLQLALLCTPAVAPCCPLIQTPASRQSLGPTSFSPTSPAFFAVMMASLSPRTAEAVPRQVASVHALPYNRSALAVRTPHGRCPVCPLRANSTLLPISGSSCCLSYPIIASYLSCFVCVLILSLPPDREHPDGKAWVSGVFVLSIALQKASSGSQRRATGLLGGCVDGRMSCLTGGWID